jgi:hypothetical protein
VYIYRIVHICICIQNCIYGDTVNNILLYLYLYIQESETGFTKHFSDARDGRFIRSGLGEYVYLYNYVYMYMYMHIYIHIDIYIYM